MGKSTPQEVVNVRVKGRPAYWMVGEHEFHAYGNGRPVYTLHIEGPVLVWQVG